MTRCGRSTTTRRAKTTTATTDQLWSVPARRGSRGLESRAYVVLKGGQMFEGERCPGPVVPVVYELGSRPRQHGGAHLASCPSASGGACRRCCRSVGWTLQPQSQQQQQQQQQQWQHQQQHRSNSCDISVCFHSIRLHHRSSLCLSVHPFRVCNNISAQPRLK